MLLGRIPTRCPVESDVPVAAVLTESPHIEWSRAVTSEEPAVELDISRATLPEHLRDAESKLLTDAPESERTGTERSTLPNPHTTDVTAGSVTVVP